MKNILFATFVLLAGAASAQHFKNDYVVNGIAYKASVNEDMHVTYIQQDNFDFPLAADSLYIDVMTAQQWDAYSDLIIAQEGAKWANGMYHTNTGCQVFVSEARDKYTGNLLIVRLFGSVDE